MSRRKKAEAAEQWEGACGQGSGTMSPARGSMELSGGRTPRREPPSQQVRGKGVSQMLSANRWDMGLLELKMSHYGHL